MENQEESMVGHFIAWAGRRGSCTCIRIGVVEDKLPRGLLVRWLEGTRTWDPPRSTIGCNYIDLGKDVPKYA